MEHAKEQAHKSGEHAETMEHAKEQAHKSVEHANDGTQETEWDLTIGKWYLYKISATESFSWLLINSFVTYVLTHTLL